MIFQMLTRRRKTPGASHADARFLIIVYDYDGDIMLCGPPGPEYAFGPGKHELYIFDIDMR